MLSKFHEMRYSKNILTLTMLYYTILYYTILHYNSMIKKSYTVNSLIKWFFPDLI